MKNPFYFLWLIAGILFFSACGKPPETEPDLSAFSWDEIVARAHGTTVNLMMWQGDPYINRYISDFVAPQLKAQYDIDLRVSSGQGSEIVSLLMTEFEAGKSTGAIDMMWINGETFYQLRQIDGLYGPFTQKLPNAKYIDFENPFIGTDFQQPVDGYECPWGNVQLALIYNSARVSAPPLNMAEIESWVKANPGRFTLGTDFTGMTLLKSFLIALAGGGDALDGPFDQEKYDTFSAQLWDYINRIRPFLWKEGNDFPAAVAPMHQMFANGELDFTMSNNDGEVDNKILQGTLPASARAYVLESGTIQNSHYMGISRIAANKAGAMVACNFMISPEAQYEKMKPDVWGDGTVLDLQKLPAAWQEKFEDIPNRRYAPDREKIREHALKELAPEYMIRLYADFRKNVIEN
jgi:putative spermidine/putrescine transport system substrate-binding protein